MGVCVLVAASEFNAADFKARYEAGMFDYIIAVDGGFAHLEELSIKPDMALGDFDSLGYVPKCGRVSRYPSDKDASDLELALKRAFALNYEEVVVYGALGNRLDHTIANIQLFARFSEEGQYVTAVGQSEALRCLTGPDVLELDADTGTVSVFSLSDCSHGVIETGMKYSLDDEDLTNRTSRGVSNELIGQPATIGVESGTLLVFYPL
ncbi:thiamine diphosphokinase [Eggerthellaceae bacterium 3-80]|uniref:thiamine diphosphokinase n=1 Tax=Adlercreutzia agrestimuris TaxID=2941324 RepID=UPI000EA3D8A0|nr:thiamine diphosphokinase [Adlercreutzia agrestimuris]RKI96187.1 thiamine diphosphokinase [bacterium D16-34]